MAIYIFLVLLAVWVAALSIALIAQERVYRAQLDTLRAEMIAQHTSHETARTSRPHVLHKTSGRGHGNA